MCIIKKSIYKVAIGCLAACALLVGCQQAGLARQPHVGDVAPQSERFGSSHDSSDEIVFNDPNTNSDDDDVFDDVDVDDNNNGLIDIWTLDDLNNIRHNLEGTSYKTKIKTDTNTYTYTVSTDGAPTSAPPDCPTNVGTSADPVYLCGYELMLNLDFKKVSSYATIPATATTAAIPASVNTEWIPNSGATNVGWRPLGHDTSSSLGFQGTRFSAILEGNDNTIFDLYISRGGEDFVGLFGQVDSGGRIRNLRLEGHSIEGRNNVGVVAGQAATGSIFSDLSADGDVSGQTKVGGLFGSIFGSVIITSSYSTGVVSGISRIGGFAGENSGAIIGSYSRSRVEGSDGFFVGGLVGENTGIGKIVTSYASSYVKGFGDVGGLVGSNLGTVNASYATGRMEAEKNNTFGGLIGSSGSRSSYQNNYWDTGTREQRAGGIGSNPGGTTGVTGLTTAQMKSIRSTSDTTYPNFGDWSNAWDLTAGSYPRLRHRIGGNLGAQIDTTNDTYRGLLGGQELQQPSDNDRDGILDKDDTDDDDDDVADTDDVDSDNDGLIDIKTLDALNNIRYNLKGTSYKTDYDDDGDTDGAPTRPIGDCTTNVGTPADPVYLCGYELMLNLDFSIGSHYASGIVNPAWRPNNIDDPKSATNVGWQPLGHDTISGGGFDGTGFGAILEGNGHTISELYINRGNENYVGLFGSVLNVGRIRNLRLVEHWIKGRNNVGAVAGVANNSSTLYADGSVSGRDSVGGLFGSIFGTVTSSYSAGSVSGTSKVGGFAGSSNWSTIVGSYSSSRVDGSGDSVGGLVGLNNGTIVASYATGHVTGGTSVGGLVGRNFDTVNASYATGLVEAEGTAANAGGLIGSSAGASNYQSNYWDTGTSDQARGVGSNSGDTTGVTGLTTAEMQSIRGTSDTTYPDFGDWHGAWRLTAGRYPRLKLWTGTGSDKEFGTLKDIYSGVLPGQELQPLPDNDRDGIPDDRDTNDDDDDFADTDDVDSDNDGLIDIRTLDALDNIRYNLAGTSYRTKPKTDTYNGSTDGAPTSATADCEDETETGSGIYLCGYELMNDLDFDNIESYIDRRVNPEWQSNVGWQPVGDLKYGFVAILEGNGHTISNLYINRPNEDWVGLFGRVLNAGRIRNLRLVGHSIEGRHRVGAIAGDASTGTNSFSGLSAAGSVSGVTQVGGLFGVMYGTVTSSYSRGNVSGENYIGGFAGWNAGTIVGSYSRSRVDGSGVGVGGLTGSNLGSIVTSYATGSGTGRNWIGGLVGENRGSVNGNYATGRVKTTDRNYIPGGLIGNRNSRSSYQSSYWDIWTSGRGRGIGNIFGGTPGVTGLTTAQMVSTSGSYPNFGEWHEAWDLTAGRYPRLRHWTGFGSDEIYGTNDDTYDDDDEWLSAQELQPPPPPDTDGDNVPDYMDVDDDNDGLIDIHTLDDLNNIRHNLAGTSYKTGDDDDGDTDGCPASGCNGYELMNDLDFANIESYASGIVNPAWRPEQQKSGGCYECRLAASGACSRF